MKDMKKIYMVFLDGKKRIDKELQQGQTVEIGRCGSYKICLKYGDREEKIDIMDASVSKGHARIFWKEGVPYILDVGSRNGTKIDGMLIPGWHYKKQSDSVPLRRGSKVLIGSMTYISLEGVKNSLTLHKGDSIKLTPSELKKLQELSSVKLDVNEGEHVVKEVNEEVRIKTDSKRSINIIADERERAINLFAMAVRDLRYVISQGERLVKIQVKWAALGIYREFMTELVGNFYSEMDILLKECEKKNEIPDRYRQAMLMQVGEVIECVDQEIKWRL